MLGEPDRTASAFRCARKAISIGKCFTVGTPPAQSKPNCTIAIRKALLPHQARELCSRASQKLCATTASHYTEIRSGNRWHEHLRPVQQPTSVADTRFHFIFLMNWQGCDFFCRQQSCDVLPTLRKRSTQQARTSVATHLLHTQRWQAKRAGSRPKDLSQVSWNASGKHSHRVEGLALTCLDGVIQPTPEHIFSASDLIM